MTDSVRSKPYTLGPDDKVSMLFIYTPNSLIRGEVVTRQLVRVSTWMRTQSAPDYMCVYNAQILLLNASPFQSVSLVECYVPAQLIIAYHIAPPNADPIDYDPSEPNRKMEPISAQLGAFRFDGCIRVASTTTLGKFLETSRESFFSMYDINISNPLIPGMGSMHVPFLAMRSNGVILSTRTK